MSKPALVVGMVVSLATAGAVAQSPDYRTNVLTAGEGADSIVTGRFNRDPMLDMAVANRGANTISVFLGRGKGRFARVRTFGAGPDPRSLRAVDINEDGTLDLVVANAGGSTISLLFGNGRGGFLPRQEVPVCDACAPLALEPGDFNADGHVDLVAAFVGSNVISTLLGRGDGTFDRIDLAVTVRDDPQWLESGDLNGDGDLDFASANNDFAASISTSHGSGDGTFSVGPEYGTGLFSVSVAVADLNNDGRLDLVAANHAVSPTLGRDSVSVLLGDGTGHFTPAPELVAGSQPVFVAVADFNADRRPDLAVANFDSDTVTIFLGAGDGTFTRAADLVTGDGPAGIATGDFNRDRVTDLAVTNRNDGTVSVFLSPRHR